MSDPNMNQPGGSPPPGERGTSVKALIVGALAVIVIIGAFFWFAGGTQDTAFLDEPSATTEQETTPPAGQAGTVGQTGPAQDSETTTVD